MNLIQPAPLQPGDKIGITCPAGYVSAERISFAVETLKQWGFEVVVGKTIGTDSQNYFSANDDTRLADLQSMLDDPSVKAILMGRGGYGVSRIIDRIDFSKFKQQPKWICGFSDIVVLLNHIQAEMGIVVLHSPMCAAFKPETVDSYYVQSLRLASTGKELSYKVPPHSFNRMGKAEAIMTGGNLAILAHLTGSVSEVDTAGKILFIEDIGEHLYHIDRLMLNLKRAGKLDKLAGLVVGSFTETEDTDRPFGQTVEEIIYDKVREYDYPVLFNFPCGHQEENVTLKMGVTHQLYVTENGGVLKTV